MSKNSYDVATVFYSPVNDTRGIAIRIKHIKLIEDNFKTIILTNNEKLLSKYFKSRIISIPSIDFGITIINKLIFWIISGIYLWFINHKVLFLYSTTSPINLFSPKRKKICHLHQSTGIYRNSLKVNKGLLSALKLIRNQINEYLVYEGVKKADFSFSVSDRLSELFIKNGVDKSKIEYLPHSVDFNIFNNSICPIDIDDIKVDDFVLMYAGSINEDRGLNLYLSTLKILTKVNKKFKLIIVGCTEQERHEITRLSEEQDIIDNVILIDPVEHEQVPKYLKIADVCLNFFKQNTWHENSPPQKIFEYFAMGKPIIANNFPTNNDYIINGYNGIIIDDFNPKDLSDVIIKLSSDNIFLNRLSSNAYEYSKKFEFYSIHQKIIDKINNYLI